MFCPVCHADYPETWKVCPKDAINLLKSSRIGKYTIVAPLGVGGMGAVYRAVNPDTRGEVAVKVMHAEVADSESARQRFKREAAAVAKLTTSHVVKVFDFGAEPDGTLYLVMELLDGHALRDEILPPPDAMTVPRVQFVLEGVLKGLSAAHKSGIIHRDLKPENIFLANTDDGEVPRLLDFGVARIETASGVTRSAATRPGTVMGTAMYMAPEQLQGLGAKVGTWSDVYAIGAMLYEMLAGQTHVKTGTIAEILTQVMREARTPLAQLRPELPPGLYTVVQRCFENDPTRRPQHADELRTALASVWGTSPSSSAPPPSRKRAPSIVAATMGGGEGLDPHVVGHAPTLESEAAQTKLDRPARSPGQAETVPASEPTPTSGPTSPTSAPRRVGLLVAVALLLVIGAVAIWTLVV